MRQVVGQCFFCDGDKGQMRRVCTFEVDKKIRKYALKVNDTIILSKLNSGDLIAQEAKYQLDLLSALYYKDPL